MNTNVSITAIPGPVRQPLVPLQSCIKKCEKFSRAFSFLPPLPVESSLNFEACLKARKEHEDLTLELRDRFRQEFGEVLALSTGCMQCETCAYPNAPCRHPDKPGGHRGKPRNPAYADQVEAMNTASIMEMTRSLISLCCSLTPDKANSPSALSGAVFHCCHTLMFFFQFFVKHSGGPLDVVGSHHRF